MIQVSTLLQQHRTVVVNYVPGNFSLFRRNPWEPLAEPQGSTEPRLKNTAVEGLNSSLAQSAGELWRCKTLQKSGARGT